MRNKLALLLLLALLLAVGVTSAQDDPLAGVDPSGVTITYWHEWAGQQEVGMDQIIASFNTSNPWGITVEQQKFGAGSGTTDAVSAGITSGELPNLAGGAFVGTAQGWYLDGVLVPLDAYVNHPEWGLSTDEMAVINQAVLDLNRPAIAPFNDQLLAWPVGISGNVMSTNLDILAQLQADGAIDFEGAPTTFDQFRAATCAAAALDGVNGFAIKLGADELYGFIASNGGYIYDAETDSYSFTNEKAIEAMQYLQSLYNDGCAYIPEGGAFANTGEFSLGLNVFAIGSSVGVPFIQGPMNEAGLDINWINTSGPWADSNRTIIAFLRGVGILQGTPEQNLATWLFIKYWATDTEAQRIWTESAQYQPYNTATQTALSEEFLASNPQFVSFADVLADPAINLWSEPAHPRSRDIATVATELYSNIIVGGMDVMEAAQAAEARANEVYEEILAELEG